MSGLGSSLYEHASGQLSRLCTVAGGIDPSVALAVLADVLGPGGSRNRQPPLWPSGISDDHSPIEYSMAIDAGRPPTLRLLGESIAPDPGMVANIGATLDQIDAWTVPYGLALDRFAQVRDLYLPDRPEGVFGLWYSVVFSSATTPNIKVYLDPNARGAARASELIAGGLDRVKLGAAYPVLAEHAIRRADDRFVIFALDLYDRPSARVKVYAGHFGATGEEPARAAQATPGIDADEIVEFCALAGGPGPFVKRPLYSSYSFVEGDVDRPSGYSVYVPIRDRVRDDAEARERVLAVLDRYGLDGSVLDPAIAALTDRRLTDGVGLISWVTLRLGGDTPGVTVYLSSEAYAVTPPRETAAERTA